jgi:hypothetical protein
VADVVARAPGCFGYTASRWTLARLLALVQQLYGWRVQTVSGLRKLLRRLRVRLKRGRSSIHSPDPAYVAKRERIAGLLAACRTPAEAPAIRLLYLDEVTYARQPTLARDYCFIGPPPAAPGTPTAYRQPLARRSRQAEREFRVVGALEALDGTVHWRLRQRITVAALCGFYQGLVAAYPATERLYVVVDNWPVHYHPDLLSHLIEQPYAAEFIRPATWPTQPTRPVPVEKLPVVLVPLPTYASWLNPIEKLWGYSRQTVTHLHRLADDLAGLKQQLGAFFDQFAQGSPALLHRVGLIPG